MSASRYARVVLAWVVLLLVLWLMVGCSGGNSSEKTLKIADIGWTENTAISALTKVLLEQKLGYKEITIQTIDLNSAYEAVAKSNLDAFQDVWLPNQRDLLGNVKDDVEPLEPWYEGQTKQGIAVPSYMDTRTLEQLNESDAELILGIEPSSVVMKKVSEDVIPAYSLHQKLVEGSTDAMLYEVDALYANQENFAFLAWSPHWMNQRYDIRYLEDPNNAFGELNDAAQVSTVVRKDLTDKDPVAYAFMKSLRLSEEQLEDLENTIKEVDDPLEGARQWANENGSVVQPWIDTAENSQETSGGSPQ
jgi:glycine betaine/proline transport system substrate-binding protein